MVYVVIEHKIGQMAEFERIFRDDSERRGKMGSMGGRVMIDTKDPDILFVIFEWADKERATKFAESFRTHEAVKCASSGIWYRIAVVEDLFQIKS
ncbi:MAG: hypothetical protein ACOX8V_01255 [Thermoleophilia bacterium]